MRSIISWMVAGIVGVGAGVVGTIAAQALMDEQPSRACNITTEWANEGVIAVKEAPDGSLSSEDWDRFLDRTEKLLDIRFKLCNP